MIVLDDVSLGWRDRLALRQLSGRFEAGSMTALVGPNGAGKSTLLQALMGWLRPLRGRIVYTPGCRERMACLPQHSALDRSYPMGVYDLVALGAWRDIGAWRGLDRAGHARVADALHAVGLAGLEDRTIGTLSGGQLQRALFARLMLSEADILLLDEPFTGVDQDTQDDMLALLFDWHRQGRTIIAAVHDLALARSHFPQALLLAGQVVAWGPSGDVLSPARLHEARHLSAHPGAGRRAARTATAPAVSPPAAGATLNATPNAAHIADANDAPSIQNAPQSCVAGRLA